LIGQDFLWMKNRESTNKIQVSDQPNIPIPSPCIGGKVFFCKDRRIQGAGQFRKNQTGIAGLYKQAAAKLS
jgi:hypothetical protein